VYEFNILVSFIRGEYWLAVEEIKRILKELEDEKAIVKGTLARGIIGVKTALDSREVIKEVRKRFIADPMYLESTIKWVPIDAWTPSDIESMKTTLKELKENILPGEKWGMKVKKRRHTLHHTIEIIQELAELIDEKVDLENPDKIVRIEILGNNAGISILRPDEVFSTMKINEISQRA
jgi:tRNA acetyltransferase TAN1